LLASTLCGAVVLLRESICVPPLIIITNTHTLAHANNRLLSVRLGSPRSQSPNLKSAIERRQRELRGRSAD
jgi:hypothetical protein